MSKCQNRHSTKEPTQAENNHTKRFSDCLSLWGSYRLKIVMKKPHYAFPVGIARESGVTRTPTL